MLYMPPLPDIVSAAFHLDQRLYPHAAYWRVYCHTFHRSPPRCALHHRIHLHGTDYSRTYEVEYTDGKLIFHLL
jgi:hypothetical protein